MQLALGSTVILFQFLRFFAFNGTLKKFLSEFIAKFVLLNLKKNCIF